MEGETSPTPESVWTPPGRAFLVAFEVSGSPSDAKITGRHGSHIGMNHWIGMQLVLAHLNMPRVDTIHRIRIHLHIAHPKTTRVEMNHRVREAIRTRYVIGVDGRMGDDGRQALESQRQADDSKDCLHVDIVWAWDA